MIFCKSSIIQFSALLALVSQLALPDAFAAGWVIVTEENAPTAIADNARALQRELSELARCAIPMVQCSSLSDEQRQVSNLILIGRYDQNHVAKEVLSARDSGDAPPSTVGFSGSQDYLVSTVPLGNGQTKAILAVGSDILGATFGVSHLRTHFRAKESELFLAKSAPNTASSSSVKLYSPSIEERAVYYNLAWQHLGRLTPLNWQEEDWEYWIDKLVCAQLTHIYFFLWSDSLYYPKAPTTAGVENERRHRRLQHMIRYAHRRGLKVDYFFCPTQIPRDIFQANEDSLKASIVYVDQGFPVICPAVVGNFRLGENSWSSAQNLMADIYGNQLDQYHNADAYQLWFYDPGGCFCDAEKHNCLERQSERMMSQVDQFFSLARSINPNCRFTVSMWPVWALEPLYKVDYRKDFLRLLSNFVENNSLGENTVTVADTLTHPDTTIPLARQLGFRTSGFIFPTNVESGCSLMIPMLRFLKETVDHGRDLKVDAIYHMRIEEPTKFANTFLASRFYWNADTKPERALRDYVGWMANTNENAEEDLYQALLLLESFMCDGAERHNHAASGENIQLHIESALTALGPERTQELEWLQTTGRAARLIGLAMDHAEQRDDLSDEFEQLMKQSHAFNTTRTPLSQYLGWISKGFTAEGF